ncbi:hypothetical protein PISMIDRAFT_685725 [Pisolithus microcarpus 441]|uniref:Uncharacterized protein n=1 Tax=Pisolithus microcarpus 441 TaxID=765257 RepID=A0A0C9YKB6_9AGAM|nr:hypothetical protein PISMIDRAFT_685725 [Pisolithus microcarpus 441]
MSVGTERCGKVVIGGTARAQLWVVYDSHDVQSLYGMCPVYRERKHSILCISALTQGGSRLSNMQRTSIMIMTVTNRSTV